MGRHLGKIGKARAEHTETFDFIDEADIRVHPDLTNLLLVDFMFKAKNVDADNVEESMDTLQNLFGNLVHPDDYDRFWAAAIRGRQQVVDLMGVVYHLLEELSERPTKRRSASSPGRRKTGAGSKANSYLRVIHRLEDEGRPDLAVMVRDAQRAG